MKIIQTKDDNDEVDQALGNEVHSNQRTKITSRAGNLSPARWVSPTNPKLGPGWALIFLA